jgi:hypothetical protein
VSERLPEEAAAAYEALRPHLLVPAARHSGFLPNWVTLLRRGMVAWACEPNRTSPSLPLPNPLSLAVSSPPSGESATELVRLMANLVLSKREGVLLCRN